MPEITINNTVYIAEKGTRISEVLAPEHTVPLLCGGRGSCRKCRIQAEGMLSAPSEEERACFREEELAAGWRLACCTRIEGACRITTAGAERSRICADGVMPDIAWQPQFAHYGAAVDIGTTTLALHIYSRQQRLAEVTAPNPQTVYGGDVMTRITRALEGKGEELTACLRRAVAALLQSGAAKAGIDLASIDRIAIAGNTTMLYFLTGRDVTYLSRAPFAADHLFGETLDAEALELPCPATVYLAPCIAAYVGGDITMALLAAGFDRTAHTALLADIGTNGELVLRHNGRLLCCSTAAGPAFEGAGLSMGMTGKSGAIDRVELQDGALFCHVIDEVSPEGICGSGVIDAVACLLEQKQLDETGVLEEDPALLAGAVTLTGKDIRMIQLAKGAIRAGMETLLLQEGIGVGAIKELAVAGGFGSYIRTENAVRIGLLPPVPPGRIRVLGNAALVGAAMTLLTPDAVSRAAAIAATAQTVELSGNPVFQEQYMEAMLFNA